MITGGMYRTNGKLSAPGVLCDGCGLLVEGAGEPPPRWYSQGKAPRGWLTLPGPESDSRDYHWCRTCRKVTPLPRVVPGAGIAPAEPVDGAVCTHEDREGVHFAIVLKVQRRTCVVLFLTSKEWPGSRLATTDELALAGFHASNRKATHLWRVERPKAEFRPRGPVFPEHRVVALRREFGIV